MGRAPAPTVPLHRIMLWFDSSLVFLDPFHLFHRFWGVIARFLHSQWNDPAMYSYCHWPLRFMNTNRTKCERNRMVPRILLVKLIMWFVYMWLSVAYCPSKRKWRDPNNDGISVRAWRGQYVFNLCLNWWRFRRSLIGNYRVMND